MIHHHILSSLCHLFSFLDCLMVHISRYFLSYVSQTRRNDNLSWWTSDYVNIKLDLHSRKLMSRYMNDSRCVDRTWLELEWNSPVLLNIILAYQNWLLAESRSGSLIRMGKIFNLYHIIYCDKCKLLKAWQVWQEIKLERKKMNIRNYIYVKFVQDKNIWFVSNVDQIHFI